MGEESAAKLLGFMDFLPELDKKHGVFQDFVYEVPRILGKNILTVI